jgi:signal transduction histidine kinase
MRTDRGWRRFYATGWLTSAVVFGVALRSWNAYVREVEQRAEDAERTRDEVARRRAMEERLRIARELHDSLTHSISVINLQAGVAVHLARKRGDDPPAALLAIQEAGSDAVRELRATLDVLRRDGGAQGARLDRLASLVEQARASGLDATLAVDGELRSLPPDVERTAYRVVQEALTNVAKHAGAATVTIRVRYGADCLTVRVDDDGRKFDEPPVPGYGLTGMRERIAALGGTLAAEPRPGRGFSVRADLPLTRPRPVDRPAS